MTNKRKLNRSRRMIENSAAIKLVDETESTGGNSDGGSWWFGLSRNAGFLLIGIIALGALGALGGGLKYLESSAKNEIA